MTGDNSDSCLQAIVDSASSQTVKFYWKVSSEQRGPSTSLGTPALPRPKRTGCSAITCSSTSTARLRTSPPIRVAGQISGEVGWQQKSYSVTSGIHILKWRYVRGSGLPSGENCGWVDFVQWTGPSPTQDPANWQEIAYKQDVTGRRVEKKVDGYSTRYCYDGDRRLLICIPYLLWIEVSSSFLVFDKNNN